MKKRVLFGLCVALAIANPALAAGTKICPVLPGLKVAIIQVWDGGPTLAPDNSNEDTPGGDNYQLVPHVAGGSYVRCGYVKISAPDMAPGMPVIEKTFRLLDTYTSCHIGQHPTQLSCK